MESNYTFCTTGSAYEVSTVPDDFGNLVSSAEVDSLEVYSDNATISDLGSYTVQVSVWLHPSIKSVDFYKNDTSSVFEFELAVENPCESKAVITSDGVEL